MAEYCTVADVQQTLASWDELSGFGDDGISSTIITAAIVEASEQVRDDLIPRYTVTQIDALSPFPPAIVDLAKYRSAMLIIQQYGQVTQQQKTVINPLLNQQIQRLKNILQFGTLLDSTGTVVSVAYATSAISAQTYTEEVDDIYAENGTRRYV